MWVPNFTDFLNISGALGSATIAFIVPELLYLKQFPNASVKEKVGCWLLIWFGFFGGLYSIYFSVEKLLRGDYT